VKITIIIKTIVKNQYKFEVKLLSATIFKVEGYGEEIYLKDNLISFQSKTLQNKKEKFVNLKLDKNNKKFEIKGSSYSGEASVKNIIGNWWSHKILQAESQISPISGSIKEQIVTFIGKENISINGKQYETDHFKLTSKDMSLPEDKKLNFDIWLDKKTSVIVKITYKKIIKALSVVYEKDNVCATDRGLHFLRNWFKNKVPHHPATRM